MKSINKLETNTRAFRLFRVFTIASLFVVAFVVSMMWIAKPLQATQSKAPAASQQSASLARVPVTHTVMATGDNTFTPQVITVTVGDTVQWIRTGGFHNVVADDLFRLSDHEEGNATSTWDSVSFTFTQTGTIEYYCEPHEALGMTGTIIVVAGEDVEETPTPLPATETMTPTMMTPMPTSTPEVSATVTMTSTPTPAGTDVMTGTATPEASETPTSIPTVPTVPAPVTNTVTLTDIVISEVFYQGGVSGQAGAENDWIELQNLGGATIDVSSWWLCARRSYESFANLTIISGDLELSPGEILVLAAPFDLLAESDLGLYVNPVGGSPQFTNPEHMIDFLQWGSPINQGRADVAVEKGIWTETAPDSYGFVPTSGPAQSVALISGTGNSAADYANGDPSQGNSNPAPPETLFYYLPYVAPQE